MKEGGPLTRFLTGQSRKTPLSKTLVFETLAKIRNEVIQQRLQAVRAGGVEAVPLEDAAGDDQLVGLDLGDDGDSGPQGSLGKKICRGPNKSVLRAQSPDTIVVDYPGSDWQVEVLSELGNRTVHMEFTVANMNALFALVARR